MSQKCGKRPKVGWDDFQKFSQIFLCIGETSSVRLIWTMIPRKILKWMGRFSTKFQKVWNLKFAKIVDKWKFSHIILWIFVSPLDFPSLTDRFCNTMQFWFKCTSMPFLSTSLKNLIKLYFSHLINSRANSSIHQKNMLNDIMLV